MKLSEEEGRFLIDIARKTIRTYLEKGEILNPAPAEIPSSKMTEERACFVTLYKDDQLRGCIGSLEPTRPLVFDVIDNAINAALRDPRFNPLRLDELDKIEISISVLTVPEKRKFSSASELLEALVPEKHGLIIKKGVARATFLPIVWKQLPEKEEFLAHLCMKAGLLPNEWKNVGSVEFYFYEAQEFKQSPS